MKGVLQNASTLNTRNGQEDRWMRYLLLKQDMTGSRCACAKLTIHNQQIKAVQVITQAAGKKAACGISMKSP
jgi:hypothetical protein